MNDFKPWMHEDAIKEMEEFLQERERGDDPVYVMEHGAGSSTPWLAERCDYLLSFEGDPNWYSRVGNWLDRLKLLDHTDLIFASMIPTMGMKLPRTAPREYDLIVVDGRGRVKFWEKAKKYLKSGGMVVWDDAERWKYKEAVDPIEAGWKHKKISKADEEKIYQQKGILLAKSYNKLPKDRKADKIRYPEPYLLIAWKP